MRQRNAASWDRQPRANLRGITSEAVRRVIIKDSIGSKKETGIAALRIRLSQMQAPHR